MSEEASTLRLDVAEEQARVRVLEAALTRLQKDKAYFEAVALRLEEAVNRHRQAGTLNEHDRELYAEAEEAWN